MCQRPTMLPFLHILILMLALVSLACLGGTLNSEREPGPTPTITLPPMSGAACLPDHERLRAELVKVTDGDTIQVMLNGELVKVRYIGIDTPEMDEPLGPLASGFNSSLLESSQVILIRDESETDRFGRMLAYVIANNRFVNYELVRSGWANSRAYPPDIACLEVLNEAQALAQSTGVGMWVGLPTPTLGSRSGLPLFTPVPTGHCDPSYPDVCIPPSPPDLNCPDITDRNFRVTGADPHDFDRDGNGFGCEDNEE